MFMVNCLCQEYGFLKYDPCMLFLRAGFPSDAEVTGFFTLGVFSHQIGVLGGLLLVPISHSKV